MFALPCPLEKGRSHEATAWERNVSSCFHLLASPVAADWLGRAQPLPCDWLFGRRSVLAHWEPLAKGGGGTWWQPLMRLFVEYPCALGPPARLAEGGAGGLYPVRLQEPLPWALGWEELPLPIG